MVVITNPYLYRYLNMQEYHQTFNLSLTLAGFKLLITEMYLEHRLSALIQLHLHARFNTWLQWSGQGQPQDQVRSIYVLGFGAPHTRGLKAHSIYLNRSSQRKYGPLNHVRGYVKTIEKQPSVSMIAGKGWVSPDDLESTTR